jgi:predicted alpha/beta-fold hydrolase
MTVFARLVRGPRGLAPRRERWELDDGDFLDVDRHGDPGGPTVVVLHGLEGSSRAPYVSRLVEAAGAHGLSAVAVNFRGCSGALNRLPRFYHSGETGDLARVVARLAAERPGRAIGVAGFSLGGNVVAKWLGERGDALPPEVRGGAVISVPFDLARCAAAIDEGRGMGRVYRERFLRTLRRKALAKLAVFPDLPFTAAEVRACRTFAAYDERVTSRLHGFDGALDYWTRASSGPSLAGVRRPLLAISSEDDPIVPGDTLPRGAARAGGAFRLEVFPAGGHVGFVTGPPWRFEFFAEARAASFLAAALRR